MPRVDEERTRCSGRISVLYYWQRGLLAAALLALGGALSAPWLSALGAGLIAWTLVLVFGGGRWWVTSDQVVQSRGVISRHTSEISIASLRDVEVSQSAIEQLLRVGSVWLSPSREGGARLELSGVRDPAAIAQLIRERKTDS